MHSLVPPQDLYTNFNMKGGGNRSHLVAGCYTSRLGPVRGSPSHYSIVSSPTGRKVCSSLDPRPNPWGMVWGKTLPGSVLSTGMPPSVLMRELQPTSVRVRLMTGSECTVEHRNFENWSSTWPITLEIWKRKFAEFRSRGIPARHFQARLFHVGSGVQTRFALLPRTLVFCRVSILARASFQLGLATLIKVTIALLIALSPWKMCSYVVW